MRIILEHPVTKISETLKVSGYFQMLGLFSDNTLIYSDDPEINKYRKLQIECRLELEAVPIGLPGSSAFNYIGSYRDSNQKLVHVFWRLA